MKMKFYACISVLFIYQTVFAQQTYHRSTTNLNNLPGSENSTGNSGTGANIDVDYYRCDWAIDPSLSKNISGTVTIYFKTTAANVSQITFDLNSTVFGTPVAKHHGVTCTSSFSATDIFRIVLPSAIATTGTHDSVSITYSGTPPAVNGQEEGFQRGELPAGSGNWYIYTLSESYEDKDWWPCKADMQDKADSLDINVTVPNAYWVAANGKLIDSSINGANRTFKYQHRYPIASYLVCLSIAKYNRQHRGTVNIAGKDVPVVYYTYPNMTGATLTNAIAKMDVSKAELTAFSSKYGPYPFADEKHGYYQHNWGGGMEHQTFSGMSGGSMASWSVIAHELAHQWFGDKVTFATWNHLWLAEGFAKYSEVLAAELVPAIGVIPASHLSAIKTTARATNTTPVLLSAASIANSNTIWTTNNDNAVYQRGAMIVSMLRAMMGDTKFFQGCRDYLSDPLLAYKSAVTADLQRNMENQLAGVDLTPFFNAWVNGSGRTDYTGNYYISGKTIQLRLQQTRTPAGNPFMPMPVVIKIANASNTYDTSVVVYHYSPTQLGYADAVNGLGSPTGDIVTYNFSFVPAFISIDPDNKTMASGTLTQVFAPMAVNVLKFAANKTLVGNKISLAISSSERIQKVTLLKSENGNDFTEAGEMQLVNASGAAIEYSFNDLMPYMPVSFYRAKIYSTNEADFSGIVKVQQSDKKDLVVLPNPASSMVKIGFSNPAKDNISVRIINAERKVVIETVTKNEFIHFDVSNLSAGIYVAQVIWPGQAMEANQFLVSHQ